MNEKPDSLAGAVDNKTVKETGSKSKAELRAERRALQVSNKYFVH